MYQYGDDVGADGLAREVREPYCRNSLYKDFPYRGTRVSMIRKPCLNFDLTQIDRMVLHV